MRKSFLFLALLCLAATLSCQKGGGDDGAPSTEDRYFVEFEGEKYTLPAEGGQIVVPVTSTGVDYATIKYSFEDSWDFTIDGNMVPRQGWISLEVIPNMPQSRILPQGRSGIKLTAEANPRINGRSALLIVGSGNVLQSVLIHQPSPYEEKK